MKSNRNGDHTQCGFLAVAAASSFLLLIYMIGCASGPSSSGPSAFAGMANSTPLDSVSSLTPQTANIRINRPAEFFGVLSSTPIKFNGRSMGTLFAGSSLSQYMTPGHLTISSNYKVRPLDLVIEHRHEYLIDVALRKGRFNMVSDTLFEPAETPGKVAVHQAAAVRPQVSSYPSRVETPTSVSSETMSEKRGPELPVDLGYGRYFALVIGNNNYRHLPKLQNAQNEARRVAQILAYDYGYQVNLLLEATRADILIALGKLRKELTADDDLLIYYAGHGWLDERADEGYWLPVDALKGNEVNWVSNASITTVLKAMVAKHVLVVADSCYSGKLARGLRIKRRSDSYVERMASKMDRSVLASGGLEPVADSRGESGHSVYASAFIQALQENEGIVDGTELFSRIRRSVVLNSDQTPEYADIRKA